MNHFPGIFVRSQKLKIFSLSARSRYPLLVNPVETFCKHAIQCNVEHCFLLNTQTTFAEKYEQYLSLNMSLSTWLVMVNH